ncbi:MAG: hypothetical protein ACJAVY_001865, partial [Marinoscillum sp.]
FLGIRQLSHPAPQQGIDIGLVQKGQTNQDVEQSIGRKAPAF